MDILYEDDCIVVCYKPAGIATQTRAVGQQDMVSLVANHINASGGNSQVFVVHRLDQPVEGVMVLAKTAEAASKLSQQITDHTFIKKYYCVITSETIPDEGELIDYLIKDARTNLSRVVKKSDSRAKKARLAYRTVDRWDNRRLLEITLYTGRHHQIRVQLSSRSAPILGDVKYGGEATGRSLALCSHYIGFRHPQTGKFMEFDIEPKGEDFRRRN